MRAFLASLAFVLALALVAVAVHPGPAEAVVANGQEVRPRGVPVDTSAVISKTACPADGTTAPTLSSALTDRKAYVVTVLSDTVFLCSNAATCSTGGLPLPAGWVGVLVFDGGVASCRSSSAAGAIYFTPVYRGNDNP